MQKSTSVPHVNEVTAVPSPETCPVASTHPVIDTRHITGVTCWHGNAHATHKLDAYQSGRHSLFAIEKMKLKQIAIVAILGLATWWLVCRWALPPGFWGGNILHGIDETDEQIARRYFGPVLLQTGLLHGPYDPQAFRLWGDVETAYRLVAIVAGQFIVSATAIIMNRQKIRT